MKRMYEIATIKELQDESLEKILPKIIRSNPAIDQVVNFFTSIAPLSRKETKPMKRMYDLIHKYWVKPREEKWLIGFAYNVDRLPGRVTPGQMLYLKRFKAKIEIEKSIVNEAIAKIINEEFYVQGSLRNNLPGGASASPFSLLRGKDDV